MEESKIKKFESEKSNSIAKKIFDKGKDKDLQHEKIEEIIEKELDNESFYKNFLDYQAHYSKERIKKGVYSQIYKNTRDYKEEKSLVWFNFYIYVRLPLTMVTSFLFIILPPVNLINITIGSISIFISLVLFSGLKKRYFWAYQMNFVVLIAETILLSISRSIGGVIADIQTFIILFIINLIVIGLLWLLPNWIYFEKRKYLFLISLKELDSKIK